MLLLQISNSKNETGRADEQKAGVERVVVVVVVLVDSICIWNEPIPISAAQDIEANYKRRILSKKFREKLEKIKNTEMENMDLCKALEKIQSEILLEQYDNPDQENAAATTTKDRAKLIEDKVKHKKRDGIRV